MANPEHLRRINEGIEVWNKWRLENKEIKPDLSQACLRGANLSYADLVDAQLSYAELSTANLAESDLRFANLSGAVLSDANLVNAKLSDADLFDSKLIRANLGGACLSRVDFTNAILTDCILSHADLTFADFTNANLFRAQLSFAVLTRAKVVEANLSECNLNYANLSRSDFSNADVSNAQLSEADLSGAKLSGTNLAGTNLSYSNLYGADLSLANLSGAELNFAVLIGTNVFQTEFGNCRTYNTVFANTNMSTSKGLDNLVHQGPSTIGIDTLYLSEGKLPEIFLRGCGIPEDMITYIPSLIGARQSIQFYSCFISYSTQDEPFAKRLHSRMRDAKLRVWFAPEDMKGGEKIFDQIDIAIQQHERLLLVLSGQSMRSEWVSTEIRKAFKVENKENRRKLFPIRLTDFNTIKEWELFDADTGRDLAVEIRKYFIPDFSNWKDHDLFEKAFERLLNDLRAAENE